MQTSDHGQAAGPPSQTGTPSPEGSAAVAETPEMDQTVWSYGDVAEVHLRRYMLVDNALEFFLRNGKTFLLACDSRAERNTVFRAMVEKRVPTGQSVESFLSSRRSALTRRWQSGKMTNFEYLMELNTLAGRSFNDMTQYPIFPWVLADYASDELDLTRAATFRDLSQPMGALNKARLGRFKARYEALRDMQETGGGLGSPGADAPYLYGSHYSNLGTVLHFLVRVEPFTHYFVELQSGRFDFPDRLFHSVGDSWDMSSGGSMSDVKELIPEFFTLPEMFENRNGFAFGVKQDGEPVDHVRLPPWAKGDPRRFVRLHRQALESPFVSANLHKWVDLVFGFKQSGSEGLKASNIFHPLTYEGAVDIGAIEDPVLRTATLSQISNYGQTPSQIFTRPHPARRTDAAGPLSMWALPGTEEKHATVASFGVLAAAAGETPPDEANPEAQPGDDGADVGASELSMVIGGDPMSLRKTLESSANAVGRVVQRLEEPVGAIAVGREGGTPFATGARAVVFDEQRLQQVLFRVWDLSIQIASLRTGRAVSTLYPLHQDVLNCAAVVEPRTLVVGGQSTLVQVWQLDPSLHVSDSVVLHGHADAVLCVCAAAAYGIAVTGSADGTAIVWDVNRKLYIQSLVPPDCDGMAVTAVALSSVSGAIVTVSTRQSPGQSTVCLWSINGDLLSRRIFHDVVRCAAFTGVPLGHPLGNRVICGLASGVVLMLDEDDVTSTRVTLDPPQGRGNIAVTAVAAATESNSLDTVFVGYEDGTVMEWSGN